MSKTREMAAPRQLEPAEPSRGLRAGRGRRLRGTHLAGKPRTLGLWTSDANLRGASGSCNNTSARSHTARDTDRIDEDFLAHVAHRCTIGEEHPLRTGSENGNRA